MRIFGQLAKGLLAGVVPVITVRRRMNYRNFQDRFGVAPIPGSREACGQVRLQLWLAANQYCQIQHDIEAVSRRSSDDTVEASHVLNELAQLRYIWKWEFRQLCKLAQLFKEAIGLDFELDEDPEAFYRGQSFIPREWLRQLELSA